MESKEFYVRLLVNDTSLGEGDTSSALTKYFSSFGKVTEVISDGPGTSLVYFRGKRAQVENVLKLNGGCEGGFKVEVDAVFPTNLDKFTCLRPCKPIPGFYVQRANKRAADEKAKMAKKPKIMLTKKPEPMKPKMANEPNDCSPADSESSDAGNLEVCLLVTGYNTWLPESDIQNALIKHFSSFGKGIRILGSCQSGVPFVCLWGDPAVVGNMQKLNGGCECYVKGGCKIKVEEVFPLDGSRTCNFPGTRFPDSADEKAIKRAADEKAKEPKIMLSKKPEPMKAKMANEPKLMLANEPYDCSPAALYIGNPLCKQISLCREMMELSMDSESSDAGNLQVRLFVTGYNTWLPESDIKSALIKHFSPFGKVMRILGSCQSGLSVVYLRGEAAVVGNMQKLNGGCECYVKGGCKLKVDEFFPVDDSDHIQRSKMAKMDKNMAKNMARKKAKKKAKK